MRVPGPGASVAFLAVVLGGGLLAAGAVRGGLLSPYDRLSLGLLGGGLVWIAAASRPGLLRERPSWSGASPRAMGRLAWLWAALYLLAMGTFVVVRHLRFNSGGFDLGIQDQVVWNTANGRPFASSIEVTHYFGDHVAPFLAFLAPLLWIWSDPRALLLAQTAALATMGPAAYRLAMRRTGSPWASAAVGGAVLLTPALGFMNRYDLHEVTFAAPLLMWTIVWAEEGRLWPSRIAALLAASTREEVGLVVGLTALVLLWRKRWGREAWIWAVGGGLWSVTALFAVLPHFRDGFPSDTLRRYAYLGGSPGEMLSTLVRRPLWVLGEIFSKEIRLLYLFQLLLPMAGRPLLRPVLLLPIIPPLVHNLLSTNLSQVSIYFQYTATMIPFLIWAAVETLPAPGERRSGGALAAAVAGILLATGVANVSDPALLARVGHPHAEVHGWEKWVPTGAFEDLAGRIPEGQSVLATDAFVPHLSHRRRIGVFRGSLEAPPAQWILLSISNRRDKEDPRRTLERIRIWLAGGDYVVAGFREGLVLLARDGPVDSDAARDLDRFARGTWGVEGVLPGGS